MNSKTIAERYEVIKLTEDQFVNKAIVKDHKAFGKLRTILSVNDDSLSNPNVVKWFNSQSELFTSISSDHVVDFIDRHAAGEIMESPVIIVEEPGITLADLMSRGAIQPIAAQNIITKILLGVNELHERGYLHLDIRPETIGVNESATEVKLLSLGNCLEMDSDVMSLTPNTKYGAAECYSPSLKLDRATDVYSIGFLFYEMLSGKDAFAEQFSSIVNTDLELERNTNWTNWHVSDKELEPLNSVVIDIDERLANCVHTMLNKEPEKRHASASTVINELNAIVGNGATVGLTGSFGKKDKKKDKKKTPLWAIAGGSLAAVASLGVVGLMVLGKEDRSVVDVDLQNALVAQAKAQKSVIKTLGWTEVPENVEADAIYQLAIDAYHENDLMTMIEHIQTSVGIYANVIDTKGPEAMVGVTSELQTLVSSASRFGVDGVDLDIESTPDFSGPEELESKFLEYSQNIETLSTAIRVNSRSIVIGSSQVQIDDALKVCRELSDSCEASWYEDELERVVRLKPFVMDKHEVTVSQFEEYADQNTVVTAAEVRNISTKVVDSEMEFAVVKVDGLNWFNAYSDKADDMPVVHVTQSDAADYCKAFQKRLPTEAEWELTASGYERSQYPWGQDWDDSKLYWAKTALSDEVKPVGSFPASIHGYFDLAGGVSEWTSSIDDSTEDAFIKGASRFDSNMANMRVAVRRLESKEYSGEDVGFRCVEELTEWPDTTLSKITNE